MNVERYRELKLERMKAEPAYRSVCFTCRQPRFTCFCPQIQRFDPKIKFVILIHPIEARRRIATGRMSHLCLKGSHLIEGEDYSENKEVNEILADDCYRSVILYPGRGSTNLSLLSSKERSMLFADVANHSGAVSAPEPRRKLAVFVIDGTWNLARKMVRLSQNLHGLERVCFSLSQPSRFRVRKQPAPGCFSTIEAIYHSIDLLGPAVGFDTSTNLHGNLLNAFDHMVEQQIVFVQKSKNANAASTYRREAR